MAQKRSKPGPLITAVTGSGDRKAVAALIPEYLTFDTDFQETTLAVRRFALRYGMTPSVAALVVELAGFGGA